MNRLAAMHDCPLLRIRAVVATSAARCRSAEGRTRKGSLPPSSSTDFLTTSPATAATAEPAGPEPVRVTATTRSSRRTDSTMDEPMSRVWKAPSGKPARVNSSWRNRAV